MWSGDFFIGNCFAIYKGKSGNNDMHSHVTLQITFCDCGNIEVIDEFDHKRSGNTFLITPLTPHSISSKFPLTIIYLEPQSELAYKLLKKTNKENISTISLSDLTIDLSSGYNNLIQSLSLLASKPSQNIDDRLLRALHLLSNNPGENTISNIAQKCRLSESRLRTIARQQLGISLATWHLWCKLQMSINSYNNTTPLVQAAINGGFSDQAHLNRTMRRMFGINPSTAIESIK